MIMNPSLKYLIIDSVYSCNVEDSTGFLYLTGNEQAHQDPHPHGAGFAIAEFYCCIRRGFIALL